MVHVANFLLHVFYYDKEPHCVCTSRHGGSSPRVSMECCVLRLSPLLPALLDTSGIDFPLSAPGSGAPSLPPPPSRVMALIPWITHLAAFGAHTEVYCLL